MGQRIIYGILHGGSQATSLTMSILCARLSHSFIRINFQITPCLVGSSCVLSSIPTQISLVVYTTFIVVLDRNLKPELKNGRTTRRRRQRRRWSPLRVRAHHLFPSNSALILPSVTDTLNQTTKGLPIVGGITEPLLDTVGGVTEGLPIVSCLDLWEARC